MLKRSFMFSQVQKQLAQMGLSDDAMKHALTQISQNTEVRVCRLTSDDVKMYSNGSYHGRYNEDGYRMSSYRNIHKSNQYEYTSHDRFNTSRNRYSYKEEKYRPRSSDYSRHNELENVCVDNVIGRRKSYKRKRLSPTLHKVKKRMCYSYDDNDKICFIGDDKHTTMSDRETFLRERNTTTCNSDLIKIKTVTSSKKDVKDSVRDKLDIVNKKSFPRVEKPDVDSHSKTDVKLNTYKSNSEGNTNKKTETSEIDSSNLTGISCEILQRDRNCNSENNAISSKVEEEKEETIPRMKEHSAPSVSDIPENVDVKCQERSINSEVVNCDSFIVVPNQLSPINYNFHVPVTVKHSLPEVNSSPVQKSAVKIQSLKIGNDKVSKSKQLCEEKCSDGNVPSPWLSVIGSNILKTKQLCTRTSGCDRNSEKTIDSQQQYLTSSDGKNKKRTGISSSRDATDDFSSEKMSEYDKYTAALLTTKKYNTGGIKRNEKIINRNDKLRITSKNVSSKIITDGVKRTSPSHYITIDEYYKQKSSLTDKDFSAIDNENKISFQKIVPLQRNPSVSVYQPDLNTDTESMQHLDKINTSERKISVPQCKVVSKTSPDKKLENAAYRHECKILKPDQRRSSAPINGSDVNKKEHRKRRHSYNEERLKSFKNLHVSNKKNASNLKLKNFKEDKNLQNTCTISALNPSVKNKHLYFFDKIERDISYLPESEIKLSGKKRKKIKDLFGDEEDFEEPFTKKERKIERQESQFTQNEHSNIEVMALNYSPLEVIGIQTHKENVNVNVELNMENIVTLYSSAADLVLNTLIPCHETSINKVGSECASLNETEKSDNSNNNQNTKNNASCDSISRSAVNKQIKCFDQKEQGNNIQTCVGEKLSNEYAKDLKIGSQVVTSVSVKTKTAKSHQERKTCLNIQGKQDLNKMETSENGFYMDKAGEQGASMKKMEDVCDMETQSLDKMHQIVKEIYVGESISTKEVEKVSQSSENISDSSRFMTKSQCRPSDMEKQVEILNASTKVSVKTKISESDTVEKSTLTLSNNQNCVQEKENKDVTEDNSLSRNYNRQVEISTRGEDSTEESNGKKNTSQILAECTALNQIEHNSSLMPSEVTEDTVCCNTTSHQEQSDNLIENEVLCNVSPQTDTDKKRLVTAMYSHSDNDNSEKRASTNLDVSTENVKHSLINSAIDSAQNLSVSKLPDNATGFRLGKNSQINERNINLQNLLIESTTPTLNEKQNISNSGELNSSKSSAINEKQNSSTPDEFNLSESSAANKKQNMSIPDKSNVSDPSEYNNAASGAIHDNRSVVTNATPTYRIKVRDPEFLGIRCERNIQSQSNVTQTVTGMHQKNFSFQEMNKNLQELAEIIYTVLHDKDRCLQRKIAAYSLTDELKATEVSLATRDFYHSIDLKLKSFFKLYLYVENGLKYNAIETVLRRVNEISKIKQYSLTDLHSVIKLVLRQKDNKRSTENFHSNKLASVNSSTASNSTFFQTNTIPSASSLESVPVQRVNIVSSEIMNHSDNGGTISHNLISPHLSNMTVEFQKKFCDTVNSVNTLVSRDTSCDESRNRPKEKSSERSNPTLPQSSSLMLVQSNHSVQSFDHSTNRHIVPSVVVGTPRFANHSVIHYEDKQPNVNISNRQTQVFQQGVFHNTVGNTSNQVSHQQLQINENNNLGLSFSGRNEKDVQVSSKRGIENHSERSLMEPLPSSGHIMTSSSVNCQQYPQELGLLPMQKLKHSKSGHVFDKRYEQQEQKQIQELQKQQQNHQSQQHDNQRQQTQQRKQLQIWQQSQQRNQQQNQQVQHNYEQNNQQVLHHYHQNLQHVQHNYQQNNKQLQLHYQQNPQQQIRLNYQQSNKQNPQQLSHYQQNNKQQNQQVQQMHHYQQNLQQRHYQQNLQQLKPNPQQMYQHYQQNHQQWSPQQMQQQLNQNPKLKQFQQWYQHKKQQLQREQRCYEIQQQKPSVLTSFLQPQSGHQLLSLPPPPPLRQLQSNLRPPPPLLTKQQSKSEPISAPQTQMQPQSYLPPSQSQQILHSFLPSSNIHNLAFIPFQAQFLPPRPPQPQQQQPPPPPPPPPPLPPPSYESWQRELQPAILLNSQICGQINSQTTTGCLVAKDSCQQNKTTNYQSVAKSFEREATENNSINQQISYSTDKGNIVAERNNPNIKKINKQDVAKNHKETYSRNTSCSELDQGSAEIEIQKPVPENQSTNSKLMTPVHGDGGENETNKRHQEQNMCLETSGKTSNSQICGQSNSETTTGCLVAKDSCQQNKTTNYQSVTKSFEREATENNSINQQISYSTDKDNVVAERNNPNIKKKNKQDVAKNHKETYSSNTSCSELNQGSAETEIQIPVPENQSTNSKLMTSVHGDGGENETNKRHQEQNMCLETSGKTSCRTTKIEDADNKQNQRISSCPSINNTDERNVHVQVEARDIGIQVSYPDPDTSADKDSENMNKKLDLCPRTEVSTAVEDFYDLTVQSPLPDIVLDQNDVEEDADIQVIGEFASQPRTISRDSGYTTPGPVGSFSFKEDQEGVDITEEEETTWENYDDIFEVKDEISDWKPALQSEPEKDVSIVALSLDEEIMCANCNKIAEVICTGCKNTCYCSEKCQLDHWNEVHHTVCCTPDIE